MRSSRVITIDNDDSCSCYVITAAQVLSFVLMPFIMAVQVPAPTGARGAAGGTAGKGAATPQQKFHLLGCMQALLREMERRRRDPAR